MTFTSPLDLVSPRLVSARLTPPSIVSVSRDDRHRFSKPTVPQITLLAGLGVEGDAHAGATVRHRYLVKKDPTAPNRTQVHLIQSELFPELAERGFAVSPGELGENITTVGVHLLDLPVATRLHLGATAIVEVTGLRSPCSLINGYQKGLMKALIETDAAGGVLRKSGIMGIVIEGGTVKPGDGMRIELPAEPHRAMGVV